MLQRLKAVNWKVFWILYVAGLFGVIAVLPFMAELVGAMPPDRQAAEEMPLPLIVLLAVLQNGILLAVFVLVGMILAERIGMRMPLIRAWATGGTPRHGGRSSYRELSWAPPWWSCC